MKFGMLLIKKTYQGVSRILKMPKTGVEGHTLVQQKLVQALWSFYCSSRLLEISVHTIEYSQTVPISLQRCWHFFSSPQNLKVLTPPYLGFTEDADDKPMYEGQIIIHTLRPIWGIRVEWVTEITHIKSFEYFVDEQRIGPYKFWHHEHRFQERSGGTEILDKIHYLLPYGLIGKAINQIKIKNDLRAIFTYRQTKIAEIFGSVS